ncbi:hypothetical protein EV360DRAFT_72856 [Lentinula raphanica]|nr:hypothetical protein EV360DRAFT_72856 [Lentinula raphanica]
MITLYDLPSRFEDPNPTYSPFVGRVKLALQHKGLPFTTHWIEYSEITAKAKEIGAPPTSIRPDGSPLYTVPFIFDSETNLAVSDSFLIVKYLDHTYPKSGPTLIPAGTDVLQNLFALDTAMAPLLPLYTFLRASIFHKLSPSMQEAYVKLGPPFDTQAHLKLGKEELKELWTQMEAALGRIDGAMGERNTLVAEKQPTFADAALGANLHLIELVVGTNSEEWTAITSTWHNGRWGKYLSWLESYGQIDTI